MSKESAKIIESLDSVVITHPSKYWMVDDAIELLIGPLCEDDEETSDILSEEDIQKQEELYEKTKKRFEGFFSKFASSKVYILEDEYGTFLRSENMIYSDSGSLKKKYAKKILKKGTNILLCGGGASSCHKDTFTSLVNTHLFATFRGKSKKWRDNLRIIVPANYVYHGFLTVDQTLSGKGELVNLFIEDYLSKNKNPGFLKFNYKFLFDGKIRYENPVESTRSFTLDLMSRI